eukprot:4511243-Amphidinium_carterae.1
MGTVGRESVSHSNVCHVQKGILLGSLWGEQYQGAFEEPAEDEDLVTRWSVWCLQGWGGVLKRLDSSRLGSLSLPQCERSKCKR